MNRFKFRAWDFSTKEIITVGDDRRWGTVTNHYIFRNYEDDVIMQYTGTTDKNGQEVYEDDIVEIDLYEYAGVKETQTIAVGEDTGNRNFYADLAYLHSIKSEHIEVIGNTYQNEDLL